MHKKKRFVYLTILRMESPNGIAPVLMMGAMAVTSRKLASELWDLLGERSHSRQIQESTEGLVFLFHSNHLLRTNLGCKRTTLAPNNLITAYLTHHQLNIATLGASCHVKLLDPTQTIF